MTVGTDLRYVKFFTFLQSISFHKIILKHANIMKYVLSLIIVPSTNKGSRNSMISICHEKAETKEKVVPSEIISLVKNRM